MADEIDIRSGGAIAVDTEALHSVGERLGGVGRRFEAAASHVRRAEALLLGALTDPMVVALSLPTGAAPALENDAASCAEEAAATRVMADTFEVVELQARMEALAVSDPTAAAQLQAQIDALLASDPRIARAATLLVEEWKDARFHGLASQDADLLLVPALGVSLGSILLRTAIGAAATGIGVIDKGTVLAGPKPPVVVAEVARTTPTTPPKRTADLLRGLPNDSRSQVRVETYTYADGSREHIVYIDGTQTELPGENPWDMGSNWDGYTGNNFASLEATKEALEMAGVAPDEALTVVGHSQGGMIATHLAMDADWNVKTVMLAGSPTTPTLDDDQTLVQFAHTADPVASLAGGGSIGTTGAPGSFVVTREGGEGGASLEAPLAPHNRTDYIKTAAAADASGDARVVAFNSELARLSTATTVTSVAYQAKRP